MKWQIRLTFGAEHPLAAGADRQTGKEQTEPQSTALSDKERENRERFRELLWTPSNRRWDVSVSDRDDGIATCCDKMRGLTSCIAHVFNVHVCVPEQCLVPPTAKGTSTVKVFFTTVKHKKRCLMELIHLFQTNYTDHVHTAAKYICHPSSECLISVCAYTVYLQDCKKNCFTAEFIFSFGQHSMEVWLLPTYTWQNELKIKLQTNNSVSVWFIWVMYTVTGVKSVWNVRVPLRLRVHLLSNG